MKMKTDKKSIVSDFTKKATDIASGAANAVSDAAAAAVEKTKESLSSTSKRISVSREEKNIEKQNKKEMHDSAMEPLIGSFSEEFINALGVSPLELTGRHVSQIQNSFPVPREQYIFWADAEFDLRPSGIAVTSSGVFIRTNTGVFESKQKTPKKGKKTAEEEKNEMETEVSQDRQHLGKSILLFYSWEDYDPSWFTSENSTENKALLVEPQCSKRFIEICQSFAEKAASKRTDLEDEIDIPDTETPDGVRTGISTAAAVESAQTAVFVEQKAAINTPAGHGEMAEEANNLLDRLNGLDAIVVGRDNAKDGPDRVINSEIFIQTKYYKSAKGSLEACFNPENGLYRYMRDGKPMQLEVPKDQYERVLQRFEYKIKTGKVPGVTDPAEAKRIVRQGRLTYRQAVNLTKPGTIESLTYDALTGAVICGCAFGISFVATLFLTYRKTGDLKEAIRSGITAGFQVFGLSFVQHMVVSQVARTSLANALMGPSQYVVAKLGTQTSATIVNGIRALSGKSAIYGAAATKHLAKIMRTNVLTSTITFVVFSVPETYKVSVRKISGAQYAKNMSVLAGSILGGAGGAVGAGIAASKVAGALGTAVAPGVGTAVGIVGGFVGGAIGAATINSVGNVFHENDTETYGRLFNAYVSLLITEYLLDEDEIDKLIKRLDEINPKTFKSLFENISRAKEQEPLIRDFLESYFDEVIQERMPFSLPDDESIVDVMNGFMEEDLYSLE